MLSYAWNSLSLDVVNEKELNLFMNGLNMLLHIAILISIDTYTYIRSYIFKLFINLDL